MLPSLRDEYSAHHPDRRKSARYEFSAAIEIEWCSKKYWGRVRNISRHGLFIELPDLPVLNAEFSASLALNKPLRNRVRGSSHHSRPRNWRHRHGFLAGIARALRVALACLGRRS